MGPEASRAAHAVGARAFAVGARIVFGDGEYDPDSRDGLRLIAHEVAHTLQQPSPVAGQDSRVSQPGDPLEQEADRIAEQVLDPEAGGMKPGLSGAPARPRATDLRQIQRSPDARARDDELICDSAESDVERATDAGTDRTGDLYVARKSALALPFADIRSLGPDVNTAQNEVAPQAAVEGEVLYFAREGSGLFRATQGPAGFESAVELTQLMPQTGGITSPVISQDEQTLFFASDRPDGVGTFDIWVTTRPGPGQPFGEPENVAELNSSAQDLPGWLSPDGCRLYLSSSRNGSHDIFVAEREPGN